MTGQQIWDETKEWWWNHPETPKELGYWVMQHQEEFVPFLDYLIAEKVQRILEIGAWWYSTAAMLSRVGEVWTMDPHYYSPSMVEELGIHFLHGWSDHLVEQAQAHSPYDLIFHDAGQNPEELERDWENYHRMARIWAIHDVCHTHIDPQWDCYVPQFFEQWKNPQSFTIYSPHSPQQDYGIGVIPIVNR